MEQIGLRIIVNIIFILILISLKRRDRKSSIFLHRNFEQITYNPLFPIFEINLKKNLFMKEKYMFRRKSEDKWYIYQKCYQK